MRRFDTQRWMDTGMEKSSIGQNMQSVSMSHFDSFGWAAERARERERPKKLSKRRGQNKLPRRKRCVSIAHFLFKLTISTRWEDKLLREELYLRLLNDRLFFIKILLWFLIICSRLLDLFLIKLGLNYQHECWNAKTNYELLLNCGLFEISLLYFFPCPSTQLHSHPSRMQWHNHNSSLYTII